MRLFNDNSMTTTVFAGHLRELIAERGLQSIYQVVEGAFMSNDSKVYVGIANNYQTLNHLYRSFGPSDLTSAMGHIFSLKPYETPVGFVKNEGEQTYVDAQSILDGLGLGGMTLFEMACTLNNGEVGAAMLASGFLPGQKTADLPGYKKATEFVALRSSEPRLQEVLDSFIHTCEVFSGAEERLANAGLETAGAPERYLLFSQLAEFVSDALALKKPRA